MNFCCFIPQHRRILKDLSRSFPRCFLSLQSEILLNTWPRVTAGTTFVRRHWKRVSTIILQPFFSRVSPSSREKYLPETSSKKPELTLESRGTLQLCQLWVYMLWLCVKSSLHQKMTNLSQFSYGRIYALLISESAAKTGQKCVLLNSEIKQSLYGGSNWLLKQKLLRWVAYVQGFLPAHAPGRRQSAAL